MYICRLKIVLVMKRFILVASILLIASAVFSQTQKIAVYVTGGENVSMETKKIIGSELVSAIAANEKYNAVERTAEFLSQINKEQNYQRSGNVDDSQISELGKQYGVDLVCVTELIPYESSYYIQARLIDVETATIKKTAREISDLANLPSIIQMSESLANKLVGVQKQPVQTHNTTPQTQNTTPNTTNQNNGAAAAAVIGAIADALSSSNSLGPNEYTLTIKNTHSSPRKIYVAGKYIGLVPANSTKSFKVPVETQGKIKSIQASGYVLYPSEEYSSVNNMKRGSTASVTL